MENSSQLLMAGWGAVTSPSTRSWNTLRNETYPMTLVHPPSCSQQQVAVEGIAYGVDSNSSPNSDTRQDEATNRWSKTTPKKKKITDKKYRRYEKPPYSYVGLIALAIQSSSSKMLKLSEILSRISTMFPFFKGEYQGWRDSVRHNLSQNKCFKKVLTDPHRPQSKGNYWTVDVSEIPAEKLKRQNTAVSRNVAPGYAYARDLNDIFDMSTGKLKVSSAVGSQHGFNTEAMDTFFSDYSTPSNLQSEQAIAESNPFAYAASKPLTVFNSQKPTQYNTSVPLQTTQTAPHPQLNPCSTETSVSGRNAQGDNDTDASDISDADDRDVSSAESSIPTDSSDDSQSLHVHPSSHGRGKSCRNKRKRARRGQEKKTKTRCSETQKADVVTGAKHIPPNQKPFGENRTNPAKGEKETDTGRSVLWSSIDQTVGPEGPPNVTWTSSTSLNDVRSFFQPVTSQFDVGRSQWQNDASSDVSAPVPAEQNVEKPPPHFADQTDFLTEQAAILPGRPMGSYSQSGVNHTLCPAFGTPAVSENTAFGQPTGPAPVHGGTNLLLPPIGLTLDPLAGNLSHTSTPYLNPLESVHTHGSDKRYPSYDDNSFLHLEQNYGWPSSSAPFSDWMCNSFIPPSL